MTGDFRPCLLIPVYNHGTLIEATLARLVPLQLPCLIVDDGSDAATAQVLDRIAAEQGWITLFRQPGNRGKGVAVLRGIAEARRLGYTHAVQVDADGQHAVEDIPRMLAMAEAEPAALISGAPIYDDSVPRSRLYGRYITHFWVWIETLSFAIVDSMCGFRVYPVAATDDLAVAQPIGRRMDFDTDVMVRLYWCGVPVRFLKTRVHYPADGISHFHLWRDNLRITRMHTRLVFGMLPRLPVLLWRKLLPATGADQGLHWSEIRENGAYVGMAVSVACYRLFGRRALYRLLYLIVGYFYLTKPSARRASQDFLRRVEDCRQRLPGGAGANSPLSSFRQFMHFGRAIVDRIGAWAGDLRRDELEFPDRQLLLECIATGRGGIILSSHLGNIEMCRGLVDNVHQFRMNVLVFNDNAAQINRLMKRVNPRVDTELIQIGTVGPDTAMIINDKLSRGEFVVIAADRTPPSAPEKSIAADFMGATAYFPEGVFILAGLLDCPVFLMFCLWEQPHYRVYLERFADRLPVPRRQRAALLPQYIQRYAQRLEHYALQAPEQWFNFFDFWAAPRKKSRSAEPRAPSQQQQQQEQR